MKNLSRKFIILTCALICFEFLNLTFFTNVPQAKAIETDDLAKLKLSVPIPGGDLGTISETTKTEAGKTTKYIVIPWLAKYIGSVYRYGVVLGSILAVMMIMIGGILYLTGGMNPQMISRGKEMISGAVFGLILILASYILMNTVNPNLVKLKPIEVEVVKTQAIMDNSFCSSTQEADSQFEVDTSKTGNKGTFGAEWNSKPTCGEDFSVKLKAAVAAGGDLSAGNQTCKSDYCQNPKEACIDDYPGATGWGCYPVLLYGQITLPDLLELLETSPKLILGGNFYIDEVRVIAVNPDGWIHKVKGEGNLTAIIASAYGGPAAIVGMAAVVALGDSTLSMYHPATEKKEMGKKKLVYSFTMADLKEEFSNTTERDNWAVLLEISVNDASWVILPTVDDDFMTSPKQAVMGAKSYEVSVADVCSTKTPDDWLGKNYIYTAQISGGKPYYVEVKIPVTIKGLKEGEMARKWNVNITKDFFKHDKGETVEGVDCKYATAGHVGNFDKKTGEKCESNTDCIMGLWCKADKICGAKVNAVGAPCTGNGDCGKTDCTCSGNGSPCSWGDLVSDAGSCKQGANGFCDCKTILFCNQGSGPTQNKCIVQGKKVGDPCDVKNAGTCDKPLICDDNKDICVDPPPTCKIDKDCVLQKGWGPPKNPKWEGDCVSAGYCDCDNDNECAEGYRCADNKAGMYDNSDPCVLE